MLERRDPVSLGWGPECHAALAPWRSATGPLALIEIRATGRLDRFSSTVHEIGVVLLEPDEAEISTASIVFDRGGLEHVVSPLDRPATLWSRGPARAMRPARSSRSEEAAVALRGLRRVLAGRTVVVHDAERVRDFLARNVDPALAQDMLLDLQELLALCHPDAPDLELGSLCRRLLGRDAGPGALDRALDLGCLLSAVAIGARAGTARYGEAKRILTERLPGSPWRALVDPAAGSTGTAAGAAFDFAAFARRSFAQQGSVEARPPDEGEAEEQRFLAIGETAEEPVPFELGAIAAALADAERGERHFPGYRVRKEQIELARQFVHVLQDGGVAKLEGGTGVGKSLAYLAAVIPFAMARAEAGEREAVVLSTRTKLLQDQLLHKDIAAAARFLGHPGLRALSIKGRANYVCERRLAAVLADAGDPAVQGEWQRDFALLEACARIRPAGEVGTGPAALHRLRPRLRELLRASVATRADQCSREQCGHEKRCPFGRHRRALAKAHLVVANHDLLLRWPPDYPAFSHVVADEGHELGGVAEEVYSIRIRPEEIEERLEVLFGAPVRRGQRRYATRGLVAASPTKSGVAALERNRSDLRLELDGLGSEMAAAADGYGGAELPSDAGRQRPAAARLAQSAAGRLEALASQALREGPERRFESGETSEGRAVDGLRNHAAEEEALRAITSHAEALLAAAHGLRMAFAVEHLAADNDAYVGAFEGLESPFDRWTLVLRPVDPGPAFREEFLGKVESLSVVSATLFVGGDDHAALGEIGLADTDSATHFSYSVASPFPYAQAMRVVALSEGVSLVEDTAMALATLARQLGGRTLGLFTSLARMREVAERLEVLLEGEGLEILVPLRASDDPGGLVERFRRLQGAAVMLGSRRYWQGIDVRGDDLQAVVIEKLPFDVPTELRRRRDLRLRAAGEDPFARASLGRMLLHLKQMAGRLIRSETDRGMVVIVDARPDRGYFRRLADAFPDGVAIERAGLEDLPRIAGELGLGTPRRLELKSTHATIDGIDGH